MKTTASTKRLLKIANPSTDHTQFSEDNRRILLYMNNSVIKDIYASVLKYKLLK